MTENAPEGDRHPAEQYETDTQVETGDQADPQVEVTTPGQDVDELKHGNDIVASGDQAEPVEPTAVEVAPTDPVIRGGKEYDVTPEGGHRLRS